MVHTIVDVERRLTAGLGKTPREHELCLAWLSEYREKYRLSLKELDALCSKDANWVFSQIFG